MYNSTKFDFNEFKKIWNSGSLNYDDDFISHLVRSNPLLHEILCMQGTALAVLDINTMMYPLILGAVEKVCGWSSEYFYGVGVKGYVSHYLHEDALALIEISKHINTYVATLKNGQIHNFRAIYDYRMKGQDDKVRRVCQESIALKIDENNRIVYFMAYVSDISNVKSDGKQHLSLSGGDSNHFFEINNKTNVCKELTLLSKREIEIAQLLGKGFQSEAIADKLFIAANTVFTHRQNMLRKLNVNDTSEMINLLRVYRMI